MSRWRSTRRSPTTRRRRLRRRCGSTSGSTSRTSSSRSRRPSPGLGAIEECIARGRSINVTLIFGLDRYAAVAESYIRGLERLVEGGGDPAPVASVASFFVSRVDTEADKRLEAVGAPELTGQARGREREARLPALQGALLRPALGGARREGRDAAALSLGLDLDEEPGLPGHALRRRADRPGDGEHDAARDDRGVPGSRHGRRHARSGPRRGAGALRRAGARRRRLRRRHRHARAGGRAEVQRLVRRSCSKGSRRSARELAPA